MTELRCEYLSLRFIWLYVIFMSRASFSVNPHFIVGLNVKELLPQVRRHIWILSDSNEIRTQSHLVLTGTLNHLAKLVNRLSNVVRTYLYDVFDWMLFWCHVRVLEWIYTL